MVAGGYGRTTKKVLLLYGLEAIKAVPVSKNSRVLDVACGPGTLTVPLSRKAARVDALDFSADMLALLRRDIRRNKIRNIAVRRGDGQKLPYANGVFDAAFSMFGLMFFPDRQKGFNELYRTLKPSGRAAVTSWAPLHRSPLMKMMFAAIAQMSPGPMSSGKAAATLEDPAVFRAEMKKAGFRRITIRPVVKGYPVTSVKTFWTFMVDGSAPIVVMRKKMGPRLWKEKEKLALAYLRNEFKRGPRLLTSQAWLATGVK
jgi:ubiquinone/menaquinone biosynthesis C-methylase UbiE